MTYVVGELGGDSDGGLRKNFVIEILAKKFSLPIEWREVPEEWAQDPVQALRAPSDWMGIWVSLPISKTLLSQWPRLPTEARESGVTDILLKEQGTWWFRCFLREALRQSIIHQAPQLDTHSLVYITGSGDIAGLCASVAIQLGFQRLILVVREGAEARELSAKIQKKYFGLDLCLILDSQLTLQPANGSLLINTYGASSGEPVLDDLPYLNFLKKEGLVVDIPYPDGLNQLVDEAKHVGIRHIQGSEIIGLRDFLFFESMMKGQFSISREEYFSEWKTRL